MDIELRALRRKIATACRILGHAGLTEDILGHVSARVGRGHLLVRCRGPEERGLAFTTLDDVRLVALDGSDPGDGYSVPNELPIHVEILRARPDVHAVVHAHPPTVVVADLAGVPLLPVIGAYNIPAAKLAADGIPVYPRGVLIDTSTLAAEMLDAMGDRPVCVLRGHGVTTTGVSVEQAVSRALALDSLARVASGVVALGGSVDALPAVDLESLPDLGPGFNDAHLFRHLEARLEAAGLAVEDSSGPMGGEPDE
jgi:ribulose-5-phosphate 4-epimerase/fuculose-1-phosphate aldolase